MHVPAAQMGVAAGHVAAVKHCTHLFVVVSHSRVAPEQVLLSVHWTHAPAAEHAERAGSARAAHCSEAVQAVHLPAAEQIGAVEMHVALVWHCGVEMSGGVAMSDVVSTWPSRGEVPASIGETHSWRVVSQRRSEAYAVHSESVLQRMVSHLEGRHAGRSRRRTSE